MEDLPLPFTQRLSARHWMAIDVLLMAFVAAGTAGAVAVGDHKPAGVGFDVVRYLAVAAGCAPLPFRRRRPAAVLGLSTVSVALLSSLGVHGPAILVVALAVYSLAAASPERLPLTVVAAVLAVLVIGALAEVGGPDWGDALSGPAVALVGWLAGENTRTRRAYVRGVADRAAERERQREERARRAAADERVRIARELHDVVAHALSVITVRSGVARMVLDDQPDEARQALTIIENTGRQALRELRLLVGVLRRSEPDTPAELGPAPGLADLPALVAQIGDAGVPVDYKVDGQPRPLAAGVELSAYRIVQEALTNVVRHAAPAKATLNVAYQPAELVIEVTNNGRRPERAPSPELAGETGGHGLVGMRERVALYQGELDAGPTETGFRVLARIPTEAAEP